MNTIKIANGTYLVKHKMLGTEYRFTISSGVCQLLNNKTGDLIKRYSNPSKVLEHCNVIKRLPSPSNSYDIAYLVDGSIKERIKIGASYAIAKHKIKELRQTTHKRGMLMPIKVE